MTQACFCRVRYTHTLTCLGLLVTVLSTTQESRPSFSGRCSKLLLPLPDDQFEVLYEILEAISHSLKELADVTGF